MATAKTFSDHQISCEDTSIDNQKIADDLRQLQIKHDSLLSEPEILQSKCAETEDNITAFEQQKYETLKCNFDLANAVEGIEEREDESLRQIAERVREKEYITDELEASKEKLRVSSENLETLKLSKEFLVRIVESFGENEVGNIVDEEMVQKSEVGDDLRAISVEVKLVTKLARAVELKLREYQETRNKEKKELENSLVSLTEENRDINSLLRIALVEKEAMEKSLIRLKGNEQKRGAILQIAERGLQKVGFGFMMGTTTAEPSSDDLGANTDSKSDCSESEEEVVSLASTVERIMKNLRLEITQLRKLLEDSRSDTERLQSLAEEQAQKLSQNSSYVEELEDRNTILAQNVEELQLKLKETEEEVARWREACELEVEAAKNVIAERDRLGSIMEQELRNTKAALGMCNRKLKLKEEVAAAAMAAQAAAERSLKVADSIATQLRQQNEDLTKQLEQDGYKLHNKVRHICWPWRRVPLSSTSTSTSTRFGNTNNSSTTRFPKHPPRIMVPEMQPFLH